MTRRLSLAFVAAFAMSAPVTAALPVGAKAPDFSTQSTKQRPCKVGEPCPDGIAVSIVPFSLATALKKGPVVLYFFPAAFTQGCTIETKAFADASDDFHKAGATLIGVAADPIDKLAKFATQECRAKFPVAVASPQMIAEYDVKLPLTARSNRTSFVIAKTGKIAYVLSEMRPDGHISGTLAAVRALR